MMKVVAQTHFGGQCPWSYRGPHKVSRKLRAGTRMSCGAMTGAFTDGEKKPPVARLNSQ